MRFETNGCRIYDENDDEVGEIFQDDIVEPFVIKLEGIFTQQELVDVLNKLMFYNEEE